MRLCVVSFKECWRDATGAWETDGGFPAQMHSIASLFDDVVLVVVQRPWKAGGMALPTRATVVPLRRPTGAGLRRKVSVIANLRYYLRAIASQVRTADVVHSAVPGDVALLGMLTALMRRKRVIGLYNGAWTANSQTTLMNRVTRTCMRVVAGRRNVMLAVGGGTKPPAPRMRWIFATALSRAELQKVPVSVERSLASPPRLVYAGRLSVEKGVDVLVKAIGVLKEERFSPLPLLTLLGDGPHRAALEALVGDLDCENVIRFAGQLERHELSRHLGRADLCVHPSLTEGFCKAWLDAMAHGVPVLASHVGAASVVIGQDGDRGWLVPPGDAHALAAALRTILRGPVDWSAMRRRCRAYADAHTLESWSAEIGRVCAEQWNLPFVDGKLCG